MKEVLDRLHQASAAFALNKLLSQPIVGAAARMTAALHTMLHFLSQHMDAGQLQWLAVRLMWTSAQWACNLKIPLSVLLLVDDSGTQLTRLSLLNLQALHCLVLTGAHGHTVDAFRYVQTNADYFQHVKGAPCTPFNA